MSSRPAAPNAKQRLYAKALLLLIAAAAQSSAQQQGANAPNRGERLFESHCSACHQYDDQGMGEAPPLEDSPWVVGPSERLVRILLHGISGRIELRGRVYDREMPGFGRVLSDADVAALATYTRSRFRADNPRVTPAEVKRIRDQHAGRTAYWQAGELLELR
ncbi:MAG: cytochrome c [Bryobacterales bacterium]|nr:cytochrome c [Bryobacterales bacterium]MDE0264499.1 cytochrome c [Bryobacterales bacterium]MDE0621657.1 cytochrome c [Bryobacterales bacterium]